MNDTRLVNRILSLCPTNRKIDKVYAVSNGRGGIEPLLARYPVVAVALYKIEWRNDDDEVTSSVPTPHLEFIVAEPHSGVHTPDSNLFEAAGGIQHDGFLGYEFDGEHQEWNKEQLKYIETIKYMELQEQIERHVGEIEADCPKQGYSLLSLLKEVRPEIEQVIGANGEITGELLSQVLENVLGVSGWGARRLVEAIVRGAFYSIVSRREKGDDGDPLSRVLMLRPKEAKQPTPE